MSAEVGAPVTAVTQSDGASAVARRPRCALLDAANAPTWVVGAIAEGGGDIVPIDAAEALLVWHHPPQPTDVLDALAAAPGVAWVQLPSAGVDRYADVILAAPDITFTCAKGVYAEPVAEHGLALALAGLRELTARARTTSWGDETAATMYDANVTCLGGGGISQAFLDLLRPFRVHATVVRRRPTPMDGVERVLPPDRLHDALRTADVVFVALPLTSETEDLLGASEFRIMKPNAWLVNIARGRIIAQDELVVALQERWIGGAALDATTPEPLPPDHVLWTLDNCLITPHVAVGYQTGLPLLRERFRENVARYAAGRPMIGLVDRGEGY
jgi:phosphoglycerate dehydrogenase-like enzyme